MAFPVLKSKFVRVLSIIPKLYLRPSADPLRSPYLEPSS